MTSSHLENRITQHYGDVHMHVVFIDIVGYAKRAPAMQSTVIGNFTQFINSTIERLATNYASRVPLNVEDLKNSILKVSTSKGVALVFTFESWASAARDFAEQLQTSAASLHRQIQCRHFDRHKWCDCHSAFHVSTDIQQGHGIVYRDANNSYSIAGSSVDFSRTTSAADEFVAAATMTSFRPQPIVLHLEL